MSPNFGLKQATDTSASVTASSHLLKNPVVGAFSEFVGTLDEDEQDDLRAAIEMGRLQWKISLDDQLEKRFADLKEKESSMHQRESRCAVIEEARESLQTQVHCQRCCCLCIHAHTCACTRERIPVTNSEHL